MIKVRPGQRVIAIKQMVFDNRKLLIKIGDIFTVTCVNYNNGKESYNIQIDPHEIFVGVDSVNFELYDPKTFDEELNQVLKINNINTI